MQMENLRYDYDDKFDVLYVALGDRKTPMETTAKMALSI